MAKRKIPKEDAEKVKADHIARAILDRLRSLETRLDAIQKELNEHLEMIAEIQPKLLDGKSLRFVAMVDDEPKQALVVLPVDSSQIIEE